MLANPSYMMAVSLVASTLGAYLTLTWIADHILGLGWLEIPFVLVASLFLVQSLPSDFASAAPENQRSRFVISVWIARAFVMTGYLAIYSSFLQLSSGTRWWFLGSVVLLFGPMIWFSLLQIRQTTVIYALGRLGSVPMFAVSVIGFLQASLWMGTALLWFGGFGIAAGATGFICAAIFQVAGNLWMQRWLMTMEIEE